MTTWTVDTPLNRSGYRDNEKTEGADAPDWTCWLVTRDMPGTEMARHLLLQFPRPGIDRAAAEKIVAQILNGLNNTSKIP